MAHLFGHQLRSFLIDYLVDGCHRTHLHHHLDDFDTLDGHLGSQFADGDGLADHHIAGNRLDWLVKAMLDRALAALALALTGVALFTGIVFTALRLLDHTTATITRFFFAFALSFSLFDKGRSGCSIIVLLFGFTTCSFFFCPTSTVLFGQALGLFSDTRSFFFNLAASFLLLLTFQSIFFTLGHLFCLLASLSLGVSFVTVHRLAGLFLRVGVCLGLGFRLGLGFGFCLGSGFCFGCLAGGLFSFTLCLLFSGLRLFLG